MTEQLPMLPKIVTARLSTLAKVAFAATLILSICVNSSLAADPFRAKEPRKIGDKTEAAFKAIFEQGNYQAAENQVQEALTKESDEPLAYAIKASLAYTNQDWNTLETYSKKTLETSQKLVSSDPLRGNLYSAVGHFLEGAVILQREGTLSGAPKALSRLREVYKFLDQAEAISATDPELNLVKGYMDLMLAVNLPFSNPEQAIEKFEKNAAPQYLVDRGIALAYRDMKQYSQALDYTNRALKVTSENPELYYLKAQILREQGKKDKNTKLIQEAVDNFDKALSKKEFLPASVVKQIERERGKAAKELTSASR
ncbi:tetratricopeptide repeat protein [Scytonema sp. UIC 10036]|uniref:Sll0314/Alr1548 family TPR repeat-containing protein n=1 Tax=Scytonema sp. UIC 10036 TaxID=2304196 RepID=UPI0012DA526A|nr:Sll0314/Alr1548 family TPR repeat-containing protein [Scytonema sp. UIC 10036]MUG95808.1 tetratricopeptide repeat protein [Scytonema sp. UIC 10036]